MARTAGRQLRGFCCVCTVGCNDTLTPQFSLQFMIQYSHYIWYKSVIEEKSWHNDTTAYCLNTKFANNATALDGIIKGPMSWKTFCQ